MKMKRRWALVADGSRARILRDVDRNRRKEAIAGTFEDRDDELVFRAEHRPLKAIMADKPGRSFASAGSRRSAIEYHSDPVREGERDFAVLLSGVLDSLRIAGDYDELILICAPHMLGFLRETLPEAVRKLVVAEIDKDLTKLPRNELQETIARFTPFRSAAP